jgi:hypothetical protein
MKIHPYIEKFEKTKPWEGVNFEATGQQISGLNIVVTSK